MKRPASFGGIAVAASVPPLLLIALATCDRPDSLPTAPESPLPSSAVRASASATAAGTTDPQVLIGAGDIGICGSANDQKTSIVIDSVRANTPDATVFTLGDNAYPYGSDANYGDCYETSWGRHRGRTHPAPGDRDYNTAGAAGYFGYYGEAAGDPAKGYYSYDAGTSWHVVVLNSSRFTGSSGTAQLDWLVADLAASSRPCTMAIWHTPRFSSSSTSIASSPKPFWDALYSAGAELILNAHYRNYERFAPQAPDGTADPERGIRQFVVGTGGAGGSSAFATTRANSEARQVGTLGVLRLTLDAGTYEWAFLPIAGKTYTDGGTGTCHDAPPPVANPGGPYSSDGTVTFDGSASSDPQGDTPLTYAWDFGDEATGTGVSPTHSYAASGTYTVSLVVTDSGGDSSAPATTTVTIANTPPEVSVPDVVTHPGDMVISTLSVRDAAADGPWTFTVDWGDGSAADTGSIAPGDTSATITHVYATAGTYTGAARATDARGETGSAAFRAAVNHPSSAQVFVGAGDIGICGNSGDRETAKLLDAVIAQHPDAVVFAAGDLANNSATAEELANCYGPTWGRHLDRTQAQMGDNEYNIDPNPAWDYFGDRAGPRGLGYRSFDLDDWHIIILNDNPAFVPFAAGSEQDLWLQADLAANTKRCTLAIWHQPYFYSSTTQYTVRKQWRILWERLYAAGVEIVINGHIHRYERFGPQTPDRVRDDERGVRQFIVGTGGHALLATPVNIAPNSEARGGSKGVLKLTLESDAYTWEFIPIAGHTFTDSGSSVCH